MSTENTIHTQPQPNCPVCSGSGNFLYNDLKDHLFNVSGLWNIKKCKKLSCSTLWIDPVPTKEDIPHIYSNYHTHTSSIYIPPKKNIIRNFLEYIRASFLNKEYGYAKAPYFLSKFYGLLSYIHPAWKDTQEANIFYLPAKKDGLLLDIGCGAGSTLQKMSEMGWRGIGIDFDNKAVEHARSKGLNVQHGDLFSQKFNNDSFDAIIMNHVIEHVPSPIELLSECRRILKTDGVLAVITPNANSRGHALYGKNWRGLEIPRHLQVFTSKSLSEAASLAGFSKIKNFTSLQGVLYLLESSAYMSKYGTFEIRTSGILYKTLKQIRWFVVGWMHYIYPNTGEVVVIICKK